MHKFNIEKADLLESEERYKILPPDEILQKIGVSEGMVMADVGCGTGFFAIPASRILGDGGQVYAFDIESKMLTLLRMRLEKSNVVPIVSEESKLPLKDKLLDLVLMAFVLHEANDLNALLTEGKRVLKHKGTFAILDWIKQSEDTGPPRDERLDQDDMVNWLISHDFDIELSERLNDSHYLLVATVNH